ncbi:MAG: hypothetical protein K9G49_15740, partial [Taibaiella sp.]|nr:hypothetical protein [Taibaiella sp.]
MKKIYLVFFLISACFQSFAQSPFWAFNIGGIVASPNQDGGYSCAVGPDGTLCVTGRFSGTMDLDPGPGVANITSNGLTDIFIATYSSSGAFNWGFGIGGSTNDGGYNVRFDPFGNVVMVGFYQTSADFDPGPGLGILTSVGGTGPINYGEGFVAKYSSTGVFQWAQSLGGPTVYDYAEGLTIDELGCIYVSGEYNSTMTISTSITFSSATEGTAYLIKYDPAGTVIWGHAFGEPGVGAVATVLRGLQASGGFVYACGQFKGTANFRPWAAPYVLSTLGGSTDIDALIAKYDTAGNIVFVKAINGPGPDDEFGSIALDGSDNIYVSGWETGASLTFDPLSPGTSTVTAPGGGTNMDISVAKFNSDGIYQWGQIHGGVGDDISRAGIDVFDNSVYVTGWFTNTVDFDASPAVNSLTSSGLSDIFLARYDLDGNYICAFRTGTPGLNDWGYSNAHSEAGEIYTTGQFGGAGTDFDPTAGTWPLSSLGGSDVYIAKYDMCGSIIAPSCDSLELADTIKICSIGDTATLHAALYGTNPILTILWAPP